MRAKLIPITGEQSFRLSKRVTVVGRREKSCNVYLDDLRISRVHCVIRKTDDGDLELRDLGSTNGTRINGHKVTEGLLLHGDEIAFARDRFRLSIDDQSQKEAVTELERQRKVETLEMSDEADVRESEVSLSDQIIEDKNSDSSSDLSDSNAIDDRSDEGTRKRVVLELPPHLVPGADDSENTVLEVPIVNAAHDSHEDTIIARSEPDEDMNPRDSAVAKPSIHSCPMCLQTYMVEMPARWWHIPLRLVLLRPFKCPRCNEVRIRLNV